MLDSIIKFSIKNKLIIAMLTLMWAVWGLWSATKLPIDALPDITNNQVQIYTNCPTLAGQEVEQLVTFPIEQSMAMIPNVEEIRSISRFGLSVITVVFKEEVDIYFARQLIGERLKEAEEKIPKGIGKPEIAPVSTGLGEVYQYIIHPKPGSENKYNAKDLRTMQDWIVARQLAGTPGVAEVNSFGGQLKQYEVAVNPERLRAMQVTIPEIFSALELNNQNTGGAYIDKRPNAYFIRGIGLITSLEDIENIAVKNLGSVPVFIRDVAEVRFGSAIRYGALTYNGEVDAVGGVVMMLKGENSNEVVKRVKERLKTIEKSLPSDVSIEAYLDRTHLVNRAIKTVEKNLLEGALIVIFVLVIFLGNLRAGLIVASAIPLSLLFALGMMNVFGVSANLMSLGAIDFGLIVDGAVIVVEATLHQLQVRSKELISGVRPSVSKGNYFSIFNKPGVRISQKEMDAEVFESASKIRTSAAFGEIIILIVYVPILTLQGIEGKMFTPMAKTVGFAILGALILSLTYIPMMSALFLPKRLDFKPTFSDRMMEFFQGLYQPLLKKAFAAKHWVISFAVILFVFSMFVFSRMGGEFIPQLKEGDLAFHCILPQGSSLEQSKETAMQASRILKTFEEVKMVVAKTGTAEVPTDPMSPEASDLIAVLKPRSEWKSKESYDELGERMMTALAVIPGIVYEVSQPIEMRFNELMTGVRQDVAVKIFGENLDSLVKYGSQVGAVIQQVEGVSSPQVERVNGLPQINIDYDRTKLANYGLNIQEVNDVVSTAFAGKSAGVVFENERRFDLVVRLDSVHRSSIEDVSSLMIPTASGLQIPLSQVATVSYKLGPAQISRDEGKRRIVVGFNVEGRDVKSVVADIKKLLDEKITLPPAYYFTYGGQFQNLEDASARLMLAVPFSLFLIFLLLYFTFKSVKLALLIFTAIPMSAIGGVFALLLRGMPFSISAGIGFIALFGVAVLNGIVLIGTFNTLLKEYMPAYPDDLDRKSLFERVIIEGAKIRLRPVLMTATVASLGFLPMALSNGDGAEVQKPLATVVIGGLTTATLLTLFVLPLLYWIFNQKWKRIPKATLLCLVFLGGCVNAQERINISTAENMALQKNAQYAIRKAEVASGEYSLKAAREIPKTGIFAENDDIHPADKSGVLKIGISQNFRWPGVYKNQKLFLEEKLQESKLKTQVLDAELKKEVNITFYQLWYLEEKQRLLLKLDSLYSSLLSAANLRFNAGETGVLDKISSETKLFELRALSLQNEKEFKKEQVKLSLLLNDTRAYLPEDRALEKIDLEVSSKNQHPLLELQEQNIAVSAAAVGVQKMNSKPEWSGSVFSQRLWGAKDPYSGFSVTMAIPIFGTKVYSNKVNAALAEQKIQESMFAYQTQQLNSQMQIAKDEVQRNKTLLDYYETVGLQQGDAILHAAMLNYKSGEISYAEMSQFVAQALSIKQNYLDALNAYNQAVILLNYLN